jgi:hypothetical protein
LIDLPPALVQTQEERRSARPSEIPRTGIAGLWFGSVCGVVQQQVVGSGSSPVSSVVENSISLSRRWFRLERIDQQWLDDAID